MHNGIIQHEWRQVIFNRKTWWCLAVIICLMALIFNWLLTNFLQQQASNVALKYGVTEEVIHPYYAWFCLLALLLIPTIATHAICAEKTNKTIINYYLTPLSALNIIITKFLAQNLLILFTLLMISILPLTINITGSIDWGQYFTVLTGSYLMLSSALAIGFALSSFMTSIIRCTMVIFLTLFAFIAFEWAAQFTGKHGLFLQTFGLLNPLKSFLAGLIYLQHLSYYAFLILSAILIAAWRFKQGAYHV